MREDGRGRERMREDGRAEVEGPRGKPRGTVAMREEAGLGGMREEEGGGEGGRGVTGEAERGLGGAGWVGAGGSGGCRWGWRG